jgi:hypothetical protein
MTGGETPGTFVAPAATTMGCCVVAGTSTQPFTCRAMSFNMTSPFLFVKNVGIIVGPFFKRQHPLKRRTALNVTDYALLQTISNRPIKNGPKAV